MPQPPVVASPPVVEMALGVQFRRLHGLRGITLGPLREQWRSPYPRVEEQPPLAPAIEGPAVAALTLQLGLGPLPAVRHWFLSEDETELVQVQNDRLIVNWREGAPPTPYPRYPHMRELFERRLRDVVASTVAPGMSCSTWPASRARTGLAGLTLSKVSSTSFSLSRQGGTAGGHSR